jgi:diguanylate cyclase (GGDEF)-like protein
MAAERRINVLLIEDSPGDARLIREALTGAPGAVFDLEWTDRLSKGLWRLAQGGIDAVLLDLSLPDGQGLETFTRVHRQASSVPIVVLTGLEDEAVAVEAVKQGAQDYLGKASVLADGQFLVRSLRYAIERKRADRLKDEFLSTVSHELRTPLATIKEFATILADQLAGPLLPDQQQYLGIIRSNVDRLARMINDLLDTAKIEAGYAVLSRRVVALRPLIEQVAQSMKPLAEGKQLQLAIDLPAAPLSLFADADKVTQILVNLVDNAIKFTSGPGRVTIRVEELANEVRFRVEDTGIGIAMEDLPRLFEKFRQVGRAVGMSGAKGTGLGLAICKRLIELHGGRIWVESRAGAGSTFSFTLPRYHAEEVFKEYLKTGLAQAKQKQGSFSLVVFAIAEFHRLKARCGPEAVTRLLKEVEQLVQDAVRRRAGDVVVRWQRGELIVILAEVDKAGSLVIAERIKLAVENHTYRIGHTDQRVHFLVSSATYPDDALDEEALLRLIGERVQQAARPKPCILVVDDEPKVRGFLKETLELRDFEVCTAASGPEALEQLRTQSVDLIVLDLLMPVMDGYEVYHLLKEDPRTRDIPVLILTGKGERADRRLGIESPSYHYLTKPFQLEELLAKIQALLQQREPPLAPD